MVRRGLQFAGAKFLSGRFSTDSERPSLISGVLVFSDDVELVFLLYLTENFLNFRIWYLGHFESRRIVGH